MDARKKRSLLKLSLHNQVGQKVLLMASSKRKKLVHLIINTDFSSPLAGRASGEPGEAPCGEAEQSNFHGGSQILQLLFLLLSTCCYTLFLIKFNCKPLKALYSSPRVSYEHVC